MSIGSRIFVALVFLILGGSFIATTAMLYLEFKDTEWFTFAVFYSHLFIFFPTFGILALIAFYIPASVFVDMYWRHVPYGKIRIIFGGVVLVALSFLVSQHLLKGKIPDMWGPAPHILKADKGAQIENCNSTTQSCLRTPVLEAIKTVRLQSQSRLGLSKFARDCSPDPLIEKPRDLLEKRYCFVTKELTDAAHCCTAQKSFTNALEKMYAPKENRSETLKLHTLLLPLKVFFLLVILVIGILLAGWRRSVDRHYSEYVSYIERGVMVGAVAMLIWPISNHAFLQSRDVLYGAYSDGIYGILAPGLTFMFGAWALALLFFFFRSMEKDMEAVGKITGVIGSGIAILKYDEIVDYSVRITGTGADQVTFGILAALGIFIFFPIFTAKKRMPVVQNPPAK